MRARILLICGLLAAAPALAEDAPAPMHLPSGQAVTLYQMIWPAGTESKGEKRLRLRFVAPQIATDAKASISPEAADEDLIYLCDNVALPALRKDGRKVDEIVITLMARPVKFGTSDPSVRQFIDTFLPGTERCEWEGL